MRDCDAAHRALRRAIESFEIVRAALSGALVRAGGDVGVERRAQLRRDRTPLMPLLRSGRVARPVGAGVRIAVAACEFDVITGPGLRSILASGPQLRPSFQLPDAGLARTIVARRVRRRDERRDAVAAQQVLHRMA